MSDEAGTDRKRFVERLIEACQSEAEKTAINDPDYGKCYTPAGVTLFQAAKEMQRLLSPSPPPQEGLVEALEGTRKIMREHQEAEDAMAIFIVEVDPKNIGEAAWQKQYRELSDRQRVTRQAFRTALSHHRAGVKT